MIRAAVVAAVLLGAGPALADSRVIGGHTVDGADYPWLVSVRSLAAPNCGGTLIAPDIVLTAAHCVAAGNRPREVAALSVVGAAGGYSGVERVTMHPQYSTTTFANDIAVIRLVTPIDGPLVTLADLPAMRGDAAYAVGWGMTTWGGPASPTLQRADLTVLGRQDCGAATGAVIDVSRVCAVAAATICQGDSGGPLMAGGVQVGISAAVLRGCPAGKPGIFTNVAAFRDWIAEASGLPLARSGWYRQDGADAQGWSIQFAGPRALLGAFGYAADGSATWTVTALTRSASGLYEGTPVACRDNRALRTCDAAVGRLSLAVTPSGLTLRSTLDGTTRQLVPHQP